MQRMNPAADSVRNERLARGWSVRRAASLTAGRLSNTWWAKFEDGQQPLTDGIRLGVAEAFGWEADWPDALSASSVGFDGELPAEIAALPAQMASVLDRLAKLEATIAATTSNDQFATAAYSGEEPGDLPATSQVHRGGRAEQGDHLDE